MSGKHKSEQEVGHRAWGARVQARGSCLASCLPAAPVAAAGEAHLGEDGGCRRARPDGRAEVVAVETLLLVALDAAGYPGDSQGGLQQMEWRQRVRRVRRARVLALRAARAALGRPQLGGRSADRIASSAGACEAAGAVKGGHLGRALSAP